MLAGLALAAALLAQPAEPIGMWSEAPGWETQQFGEGTDGYCVTSSPPREAADVTYSLLMTFGSRNEVGITTSRALKATPSGTFDVEGGGLDLSDLHSRTEANQFVVSNALTRPMVRLLIDDVKTAHSVRFVLGTRSFPAAIPDPDALYRQMLRCQESLIGLVIGELK